MNKNTRKNNKKGLRKTRSKRQRGGAGNEKITKYYSPNATYNKENKDRVKQKANKMLLDGAYGMNLERIKTALTAGADINFNNENLYYGNTALHLAIDFGDIQTVEFLLKKGANIYIENKFKQDAIDLAIENGDHIYGDEGDEEDEEDEESDGYEQMMDGLTINDGPAISDGPILTLLKEKDVRNKTKAKLNKYLRKHKRRQMEKKSMSTIFDKEFGKNNYRDVTDHALKFLGGKSKRKSKTQKRKSKKIV
tara:strand:- start:808 stop:1560 length:753 start_codon:yes stop_codon:yes gene_type:complete